MRVFVTLDAPGRWNWNGAPQLDFEIDDVVGLMQSRDVLNRQLPAECRPCFSRVVLDDDGMAPSGWTPTHFMVSNVGADASHAERDNFRDRMRTCERCRNAIESPDIQPDIDPKKLPRKAALSSFYSPLSIFCGKAFRDAYQDGGLSGLRFQPATEKERQVRDLWWVRPARHVWGDRKGICDACGMKTNVRLCAHFNLQEEYPHDFQFMTLFDGHSLVLSKRAIAFLSAKQYWCATTGPILPGYLADKVQPEPRLFAEGDHPQYALRAEWAAR